MELPSRIAKQNGEIVQAASGFNQCDVTLIPNGPVLIRLYEQRLFVCRKTQAMLRSFLDSFDHLSPCSTGYYGNCEAKLRKKLRFQGKFSLDFSRTNLDVAASRRVVSEIAGPERAKETKSPIQVPETQSALHRRVQ